MLESELPNVTDCDADKPVVVEEANEQFDDLDFQKLTDGQKEQVKKYADRIIKQKVDEEIEKRMVTLNKELEAL